MGYVKPYSNLLHSIVYYYGSDFGGANLIFVKVMSVVWGDGGRGVFGKHGENYSLQK